VNSLIEFGVYIFGKPEKKCQESRYIVMYSGYHYRPERFKPAVRWTSINRYHGFHALAKRRFFTRFSSTRRKMSAFKPFLQYFASGSDTASCQDYQEYEFVECLSEEIQIIDLFTHCIKLQPHMHKLSQYTLATPLNSWYLDSIR